MSEQKTNYSITLAPDTSPIPPSTYKEYFDKIKKDKTSPNYIFYKDKFAYVDSKYTDDKFNKYFPISEQELVSQSVFQNYWLQVIIKLTVTLPNGFKMSRLGGGAARIQVSREAKEAFLTKGTPITPFDYIDYQNTLKAAITMAVKNAQERFGINADATNRIILSDDEIKQIKESILEIIDGIGSERDKIRAKEKLATIKNANELLNYLEQLQEFYKLT